MKMKEIQTKSLFEASLKCHPEYVPNTMWIRHATSPFLNNNLFKKLLPYENPNLELGRTVLDT